MVTIAGIAGGALNILIMILSIILVSAISAGSVWLYLHFKKYSQFKAVIFERDGFGQLKQKTDSGGIFVDSKTKNKRLFLRRANVGLDPDNVPYIQHDSSKIIYLLQTGLKNFHFIRLNIFDKNISLKVGEEDVNWAINAYDRQKKMFSQSLLMQLLPFIALAFTGIIILIIFIYFFKEFDTLREFAVVMKEVAKELAQARSGTTIVSG